MDKILLALAALGTKFDNFLASNATRAESEPKLKEASDLLAAAKAEMAVAATAIADRDATIARLTADLSAANEKLTASATAAAAALVTEAKRTDETLAALGVDPKSIPSPAANDGKAKTITRAAFQSLTPSEKSSFCRNGGKLTE